LTLPKGYKPNTPSRDNDDDDRPTSRPRKNKSWARIALTLIMFLISLSITIYFLLQVMETGKELDEQKKIVELSRSDYEQTYKEIYGKLPPNVPAPP
jgi:hypothetical protein